MSSKVLLKGCRSPGWSCAQGWEGMARLSLFPRFRVVSRYLEAYFESWPWHMRFSVASRGPGQCWRIFCGRTEEGKVEIGLLHSFSAPNTAGATPHPNLISLTIITYTLHKHQYMLFTLLICFSWALQCYIFFIFTIKAP